MIVSKSKFLKSCWILLDNIISTSTFPIKVAPMYTQNIITIYIYIYVYNCIYMCVYAIICIHTLSFQTLQLCRVQPKTLGIAMVMLNTQVLSLVAPPQKNRLSYKLSEFDIALGSKRVHALLQLTVIGCSWIFHRSAFPVRTSHLHTHLKQKKCKPKMKKYGSGIQSLQQTVFHQ